MTTSDSNDNNSNDNDRDQFLTLPNECEIVIVGAGVAGATAAYHLANTINSIGENGSNDTNQIIVIESGPKPGEGLTPRKSGSATMKAAPTVKMMVQLFASKSNEFIHHHGKEGAHRYVRATAEGLTLQKTIAKDVLDDPNEQLKELGSYYVAYEHEQDELREEYETLKSLGGDSDCCHDIQWIEKDALQNVDGMSPDFHCAIYFPNDAVIDSSSYAKGLLRAAEATGTCQVINNTKVTKIVDTNTAEAEAGASTDADAVVVVMEQIESSDSSGVVVVQHRIRCKHVIMATGGLFQIPELNGLNKPCYSYLVHVPITNNNTTTISCQDSPNFFTWGFTHDWSFTKGSVRCSGEDHFSAYKPPYCQERCTNLIQWTWQKYGVQTEHDVNVHLSNIPQQYGVYSETPDLVPLIGHVNSTSKVCYLLGCNAWGQTILSYCGSLIPGLLGYQELTELQKDTLKLFSIRRFSCLPR